MSEAIVGKAFESSTQSLALDLLVPLRVLGEGVHRSQKYLQILASVREIGLVEPLVVARDRDGEGKYLLLDGHVRLQALKDVGATEATCLIATDDEAYTYNSRITRLSIIQEHRMILNAIERGVSEDRLAAALNVNVGHIRKKRSLLEGVAGDAAAVLEGRHLSPEVFDALRQMVPHRQIEAAKTMVAMGKLTINYARALLAATPDSQLVGGKRKGYRSRATDEQLSLMQREAAVTDRKFREIEATFARDQLDLVLARGYVGRLLANEKIAAYLQTSHNDVFLELAKQAGQAT